MHWAATWQNQPHNRQTKVFKLMTMLRTGAGGAAAGGGGVPAGLRQRLALVRLALLPAFSFINIACIMQQSRAVQAAVPAVPTPAGGLVPGGGLQAGGAAGLVGLAARPAQRRRQAELRGDGGDRLPRHPGPHLHRGQQLPPLQVCGAPAESCIASRSAASRMFLSSRCVACAAAWRSLWTRWCSLHCGFTRNYRGQKEFLLII